MEDVFGKKINPGDLVVIAARMGSKLGIRFAVVLETTTRISSASPIVVKMVDDKWLKSPTPRLSNNSYFSGDKMWIVTDVEQLPANVCTALQKGYALYVETKSQALAKKADFKSMTPSQRLKHNIEENQKAGLYDKDPTD